jgi:hypothetical protein
MGAIAIDQYRWFRARMEEAKKRVTRCLSTCYSDTIAGIAWKSYSSNPNTTRVNARMLTAAWMAGMLAQKCL